MGCSNLWFGFHLALVRYHDKFKETKREQTLLFPYEDGCAFVPQWIEETSSIKDKEMRYLHGHSFSKHWYISGEKVST
jgi:hypothetical protein